MSDQIIYKVVSKSGGVDGRDPSEKGGKVLHAFFDRKEAENNLNGWTELKIDVIENVEKYTDELVKKLDPVERLLLQEYFR